MIRKWLKKIINECMTESMPPINIYAKTLPKGKVELKFESGVFVKSQIEGHVVSFDRCMIEQGEHPIKVL